MPLTRRTDGSATINIIHAAWWNDYMDLFTGVMTDQVVTVANTVNATDLNVTNGLSIGSNLAVSGDGSSISLNAPSSSLNLQINGVTLTSLDSSGALHITTPARGLFLDGQQVLYGDAGSHNINLNAPNVGGTGALNLLVGGVVNASLANTGALNLVKQQQGYFLNSQQVLFADANTKNLTINAPNVGGNGKMYLAVGGVVQMSIDTAGQLRVRGPDLLFNTTP